MATPKKPQVLTTLDLYRHSLKMGSNISAPGLNLVMAVAAKYTKKVTDLFRGPLERTLETLTAFRCGTDMADEAILHPPVFGLGNSEMFSDRGMITDGFKKAHSGDNVQAVLASATDEQVQIWAGYGREAIKSMLFDMKGNYGAGFFHDPTIPLAARTMGLAIDRTLKEMEGIRFVLLDDGSIQVSLID